MNFPCVSSMSDPVPPLWKPMKAKQIPALPETLALAGTDIIFPARSWCSAVGFRIRNPLLRNRCCGYLKSRTLSFPYSAIQTQQEGIRTATHPNELSTSIPPDTIPTCGIPTSLRTPHHGLLYLSWFSKFSSFLLQDRPVFPQSFPKTTLDPTKDCAEFKVCFLNSALPLLTSFPWEGLNYLITQHWAFSILHPMMSQIEMQSLQHVNIVLFIKWRWRANLPSPKSSQWQKNESLSNYNWNYITA